MITPERLAELQAYTANVPIQDHTIAMVKLKDFKEMGETLEALWRVAEAAKKLKDGANNVRNRLKLELGIGSKELDEMAEMLDEPLDDLIEALNALEEKK